jgi:hypothetical protein
MLEGLAVKMQCDYCGVTSGHWCRTSSGNISKRLHGRRIDPLYRLLSQSYLEGERDGLAYALRFEGDETRLTRYLRSIERNLADREAS